MAGTIDPQAAKINDAVQSLDRLARRPPPPTLRRADTITWQEYNNWLASIISRLEGIEAGMGRGAPAPGSRPIPGRPGPGNLRPPAGPGARGAGGLSMGGKSAASPAEMARMNMQVMALQNAIQMESRKFQTISNVMRARHDIAMAAIRNTRA